MSKMVGLALVDSRRDDTAHSVEDCMKAIKFVAVAVALVLGASSMSAQGAPAKDSGKKAAKADMKAGKAAAKPKAGKADIAAGKTAAKADVKGGEVKAKGDMKAAKMQAKADMK